MVIKTEVLKNLISKASVGIGGDKLIPITELIGISCKDGKVTIETTDSTNYVYVTTDTENKEDFEVVSYAEQFVKLVGKLTSDTTSLEIVDGNLVVTANGKYTIELPFDENGEMVKYPDPIADEIEKAEYSLIDGVSIEDIKNAVRIAKTSLAVKTDRPVLMNYYVGESIFATDGCVVTEYRNNLFDSNEILITPKFMDILSSFTSDTVAVSISNSSIIVESDDMILYGKILDDADTYATESVKQFISTKFNNQCKVDKGRLMSALDRIALFVSAYDNRALRLEFTSNGITISNMKSGSTEVIEYKEHKVKNKKKFEPNEVYINADMLIEQLKAYPNDVVTIEHGVDFAISLISDETTQIIGLMQI